MTDLCCWTQEGRDCVFPAALNWKEEGEAETVPVEQGFSVDTCGSKRTPPQDDSTRMASTRARTIALHEMANYYGQGEGSQPGGGGKGYDAGKGKDQDGKGQDKGKGKGKEKFGKGKDKEGDAGDSFRRRMAAQGAWFQRCDGWCDSVSPPPRCVRPCNEIQDIRFPEHPGPHMCRECARGEENATPEEQAKQAELDEAWRAFQEKEDAAERAPAEEQDPEAAAEQASGPQAEEQAARSCAAAMART
jgi:hypothetical protein